MPSKERNAYFAQWERENIRRITVKINIQTESEMASWLEEKPNKQSYIKALISADMNAHKADTNTTEKTTSLSGQEGENNNDDPHNQTDRKEVSNGRDRKPHDGT